MNHEGSPKMTHNQPIVLRHCRNCGKNIRANAFAQRKPKDKLILLCQKCKLSEQVGEKNPNWKGDKAGYRAKMYRITANRLKHITGTKHF